MGQKLHRKRRYSRRRSPVWPVVGWLLAAVILIPGSFFTAKTVAKHRASLPASDPDASTLTTTEVPENTTGTTAPLMPDGATFFQGFYLPYTSLRDTTALTATVQQAAAAQFNCVVVELKNRAGEMYYVSETEAGQTAAAAVPDALSLSALTEAFAALRSAGLIPVARLYAFEDAIAPRSIPDAKVTTTGHDDWTWYDGDPQNGGRPWLNPYADAAQSYIVALADELYTAGAGAIMLDGVYFPTQTSQAHFETGSNAALSKGEVLRQFITRISALNDAPILLNCDADAALGNNMAAYTVNPLSLGAAIAVPDLRYSSLGNRVALDDGMLTVTPETMGDAVSRITAQIVSRAAALDAEHVPAVAPVLGGDDAAAQIAALKNGSADASYFWHHENGNYDFSAVS